VKAISFDINPYRWLPLRLIGRWHPAVFWSRLGGLRLREMPVPPLPGPQWVRLRTRMAGICGTDVAAVTLRNHPASFLRNLASWPIGMGHENVAIVDETGPAVSGWRTGDRVVVEPSLSCVPRGVQPLCPRCAAGQPALCESTSAGPLPPGTMIGYNSFTGGSWGEYFVAHSSQLYRVPERICDRIAVLTDPVACALHGVLRHTPGEGERVLVLGGGLIGIGVVAALRAVGCRAHVTAMVRREAQAELARAYCADAALVSPAAESHAERYDRIARVVGGRRVPGKFGNQGLIGGFDVVYDCVGTGRSLTDAMKFTRAGGTVALLGTSQITVVDTTPLWFSELNVIGCSGRQIERFEGQSLHTYEVLFRLIEEGRLSLDPIPTQTFPLERYADALAAVVGPRREPICRALFSFI
jgi:L-iditol 2-dehydrogenase